MPGIILHDEDVYRLAQSVNTKQTEGYAPMGGILANNGMYYQPMVTGSVTAQYVVVREQESQNFIARSETTTGSALGDIQYVDGFFLQAFGEEPGGGAVTVAWGDITGKPSTFAPTTGTTAATAMPGNTQLTGIGGTLTIAKGGTGATTAAAAWTALGGGDVGKLASLPVASTTAAGVIQIGTAATQAMAGNTQLTAIGGTLTIAKGGTGATTAAAAWTALGGGAVGKLAALPKAAAVPDVAAAPTMGEFNALLASLRAAGYLEA